MWGQIAKDYTCNVREEVARLANLCRKYDIWLGLDSWDKAHMFRSANLPSIQTFGAPSDLFGTVSRTKILEGDEERAFTAYGEVWVKALKLMRLPSTSTVCSFALPSPRPIHCRLGARVIRSLSARVKLTWL